MEDFWLRVLLGKALSFSPCLPWQLLPMRAEEVQASGSSSKPVGLAGPGAMRVLPWGAQSTRGEQGKLCWKEEKEDMGQGKTTEGAGRQEAVDQCC